MIYSQVSESDLLDDGFESGVGEFTAYYRINMLGDVREKIIRAYRMILDGTVVGYVTVSLAHLKPDATKAKDKRDRLKHTRTADQPSGRPQGLLEARHWQ